MSAFTVAKDLAVAIVENEATIRDGIALLIESAPGFRCSGSYGNMEAALPGIDDDLPDVVLVGLVPSGPSGVEGIRRLRERHPALSVLVFTVYEDDDRIVEALRAGACGCLPKKMPPRGLLESLRTVIAGGAAPMPPDAARHLLDLLKKTDPPPGTGPPTPREMHLLSLLVEGHNYETAAADLGDSPRAVARLARGIYRRVHAYAPTDGGP